jgi:hypothetical protein
VHVITFLSGLVAGLALLKETISKHSVRKFPCTNSMVSPGWKYKEVLPYVVIRVWWVKTTACTKIQNQKKPEELSKQTDQNLGNAATMIDDEWNLR